MEWIIIIAYLLIGTFITSTIENTFPCDRLTESLLLGAFWPITLVIFVVFGVLNLVYIAGEKVCNWLRSKDI